MNIFLDTKPYGMLQYSNGSLVVTSLHSYVSILLSLQLFLSDI